MSTSHLGPSAGIPVYSGFAAKNRVEVKNYVTLIHKSRLASATLACACLFQGASIAFLTQSQIEKALCVEVGFILLVVHSVLVARYQSLRSFKIGKPASDQIEDFIERDKRLVREIQEERQKRDEAQINQL